jgi:hypothetical protein
MIFEGRLNTYVSITFFRPTGMQLPFKIGSYGPPCVNTSVWYLPLQLVFSGLRIERSFGWGVASWCPFCLVFRRCWFEILARSTGCPDWDLPWFYSVSPEIYYGFIQFLQTISTVSIVSWTTGVRLPVRSRIFSSTHCPTQLWGPPGLYTMGEASTSLQLMPEPRKCSSIPPLHLTPSLRSP